MRKLIPLMIILLVIAVDVSGQERWMAGLSGALAPENTWAPRVSAGVEAFFLPFSSGRFQAGIGAGLLYSTYHPGTAHPERGIPAASVRDYSVPVMIRGQYSIGGPDGRFYCSLDAGYPISLLSTKPAWSDVQAKTEIKRGPFLTPQVGVKLWNHFYVSAGVCCQWVYTGLRERQGEWKASYLLTAAPTVKAGVRF